MFTSAIIGYNSEFRTIFFVTAAGSISAIYRRAFCEELLDTNSFIFVTLLQFAVSRNSELWLLSEERPSALEQQ